MESFHAPRFAHVESGRKVSGLGKLVFAKTEAGILGADFLRHCGVGAEEVDELERVLFVVFPNLRAARFVGAVPVVASSDEAEGNLPVDRVVAIEFSAGQRIEIEPHFPRPLQRTTRQLEAGGIVFRRCGHGDEIFSSPR